MDAVLQLILSGGGISIMLTIGIFLYINIMKQVRATLEGFGKRFDEVKEEVRLLTTQKEKIDFIIDHFDILENAILSMIDNKLVTEFIDFELNQLRDKFSTNFTNGSHKDKAYDDINNFRQICLDHISNSNVPFKLQSSWLLDILSQALFELVNSLDLMTDYSMKLKFINTYFQSITQTVDYYKIFSVNSVFPSLKEEQVKTDLINKFKGFGTRKPYSQTGFKRIV